MTHVVPTATRPITLPDLDELARTAPLVAAKFRNMPPAQFASIFTPDTNEGTR